MTSRATALATNARASATQAIIVLPRWGRVDHRELGFKSLGPGGVLRSGQPVTVRAKQAWPERAGGLNAFVDGPATPNYAGGPD